MALCQHNLRFRSSPRISYGGSGFHRLIISFVSLVSIILTIPAMASAIALAIATALNFYACSYSDYYYAITITIVSSITIAIISIHIILSNITMIFSAPSFSASAWSEPSHHGRTFRGSSVFVHGTDPTP